MKTIKFIGIAILAAFYIVYFGKMILQRRRGINTDQIAKGKQKGRVFYTELIMELATYLVVAAEIFSIVLGNPHFSNPIAIFGAVLGVTGVLIFTVSIVTMKDSWRAGIAETERTQMVTQGIYQFSRNPAFLGFDCVYLGLLMMFFNLPLLFFPVRHGHAPSANFAGGTTPIKSIWTRLFQLPENRMQVFGKKTQEIDPLKGRGRFCQAASFPFEASP